MPKSEKSTDGGDGHETTVMSVRGAAVWAIAGQYASFAIQFVTSVIISRFFLTPAEVGLFSIGLAAAMFVAILQDFGLTRYISGLPQLGNDEIERCSSVALLFSLLIAGIIAGLAWPMAQFYGHAALTKIMIIIAASYLFLPLAVVPLALMSRRMAFSGYFWVNLGGAVANATVALGTAWMGYSALSLAWGTLASGIARGLIAQYLHPAPPWPFRLDGLKPVAAFGGRASSLYMSIALSTRAPDMIVGKLVSLVSVGLYSRAVGLSDQFRTLLSGAIGSVFYPAFARIRDRGESPAPSYLRVCAGYSAIIWPGMAGLALAAEPIVRLLYGETWIRTAPLLTMIAVTEIILISLPLVTELPILFGKFNQLLFRNYIDTTVSISLLAVGCHWGVEGAAASRLVYAVMWWFFYIGFMRATIGFRLREMARLYVKSGLATLAAIAPLAVTYLAWSGPSRIGLPELAVAVAAGGICWLATLFGLRHPALDDMLGVAESLPACRRLTAILRRTNKPQILKENPL